MFKSSNKAPVGPDYTHFSNPVFDKMYTLAMAENDEASRAGIYRKMDSLVMVSSPVVVLYYDKVLRLTPFSISGLEINAMNLLQLKGVKKIRK